MSSASLTPAGFAEALLNGIGISKPSAGDIEFVEAWEAKEGGNWVNTAKYNPLNTSLAEPGATAYKPGAAVKSYTSWAQGVKASISTLLEPQYAGVVSGLKANNQPATLAALQESPWDAGHYAGWIPTDSAGAAYAKAHGGSGSKSVLSKVEGAVGDVTGLNFLGKIPGVSSATGAVTGALSDLVNPLVTDAKEGLTYIGFAGVGLVLIAGGLLALTRAPRQRITGDIKDGAQTAATAAAVAA